MVFECLPNSLNSGRRYDLRTEEVDSIYQATKSLQNLSIFVILPTFFPILKKITPKFLRNLIFKEDFLEQFLSTLKSIMDVSLGDMFMCIIGRKLNTCSKS